MMISVVMACYNHGHFIRDAIKSILNQSYPDWELIIIDDFSTDDSLQVLMKVVKDFSIRRKTTIITHPVNEGYGSSLKDGISICDGDLIAIVDADDTLSDKNSLKICADIHELNPEVSMTYSNYNECDKKLNIINTYTTKQIPEGRTYLDGGIRVSHLKVFKKRFYNLTVGINPKLRQAVDKDLTLKMEEVGKLLYIDNTLYNYRKHSTNLSLTIRHKSKDYQALIFRMRNQIYEDAKRRRGI